MDLEFLDDAPEGVAEPVSEPVQDVQPEPQPDPVPPPVPPAPEPEAPPVVPRAALEEERRKRQALEARLTEFEQRNRPAPPDPYEDPAGALTALQMQMQAELRARDLTYSRGLAEVRHGKEIVEKAHEWARAKCDEDPVFNASMHQVPDPYEAAIAAYKREQVLSRLDDAKLDAFLAWEASQTNPAPVRPAPPPPAAPPPRSILSTPGAAGLNPKAQPMGPGQAFDAVFTK